MNDYAIQSLVDRLKDLNKTLTNSYELNLITRAYDQKLISKDTFNDYINARLKDLIHN